MASAAIGLRDGYDRQMECRTCGLLVGRSTYYRHQRINRDGGDCRTNVELPKKDCPICLTRLSDKQWALHRRVNLSGGDCRERKTFLEEMLLCETCQAVLCKRQHGRHHEINAHGGDCRKLRATKGPGSLSCGMCGEFFATQMPVLIDHLAHDHGLDLIAEEVIFATTADYEMWKVDLETATSAKFALKDSRQLKGCEYKHFLCSRSGSYEGRSDETYVPWRRRQMSKKLGFTCSAYIKATWFPDSEGVRVEYCATHYGHESEADRPKRQQRPRKSKLDDTSAELIDDDGNVTVAKRPRRKKRKSMKTEDDMADDEIIDPSMTSIGDEEPSSISIVASTSQPNMAASSTAQMHHFVDAAEEQVQYIYEEEEQQQSDVNQAEQQQSQEAVTEESAMTEEVTDDGGDGDNAQQTYRWLGRIMAASKRSDADVTVRKRVNRYLRLCCEILESSARPQMTTRSMGDYANEQDEAPIYS